MGWSCTAKAGNVMDAWSKACRESANSSNTYITPKGKYFFEVGREQDDGAIVGSIHQITREEGTNIWAQRVGSFRIEPDGTVTRAPAFLKKVVVAPKPEPEIPRRGPHITFTLID